MKINIIASSQRDVVPTNEEIKLFAGFNAGICYLRDTTQTLRDEPSEKTLRRANQILKSGHQSPFDHQTITFEFVGLPKILAMYLNNEQACTTSEKSARYTKMVLTDEEQKLYDKWCETFSEKIKELREKEGSCHYLDDKKVVKLAQENARYLTSVFTPTTMTHTVSIRQFNLLYAYTLKEIELYSNKHDDFSVKMFDALLDFKQSLENFNDLLIDELKANIKDGSFSLVRREEYPFVTKTSTMGDYYATCYDGSFAQLAQQHRHRTLDYSFDLNSVYRGKCYVPPILKSDVELWSLWLDDMKSLEHNIPQGTSVRINEGGTIDQLINKANERQCTCAQLETANQVTETIGEVFDSLVEKNDPRAEKLEKYISGSRCTHGFKCATPCGYKQGIEGTRII